MSACIGLLFTIQLGELSIHSVNFRLVPRHNATAQFLDLSILGRSVAERQDSSPVMRDHRFENSLSGMAVCFLIKTANKTSNKILTPAVIKLAFLLLYIDHITNISITIIGAVISPVQVRQFGKGYWKQLISHDPQAPDRYPLRPRRKGKRHLFRRKPGSGKVDVGH